MKTLYVETSALLAAVFHEPRGKETIRRLKRADRLVASRLLRVEAQRALLRLALEHPKAERTIPAMRRQLNLFWPKLDFIEMTRDICDLAARIAPASRLRTLDAIHLATYHHVREFAPELDMLSFDDRILEQV